MKTLCQFLLAFFLLFLPGCSQETYAADDVEYEFLTPKVLVIKSSNPTPAGVSSNNYRAGWRKENALQRDAKGNILRQPDLCYYQYFVLDTPFAPGEKRIIGKIPVQYDPGKPSNIFKLNQLGNGVKQKQKYAYMGAWLGSSGALPLKHLAGTPFEIRNADNGKTVFTGKLQLRRDDPEYQQKIPFTGEEVLELDYSAFNTPGKYYFHVENIGRSMEFSIDHATISEAFYLHARALYHKRCGIAKSQPFTAWESPACHLSVFRGRFPGNADHYRRGKGEKSSGFFDRRGNRIEVKPFDLIKQNPPYTNEKITAPGGWHDAADYDRRPYHLRIVSDLATVYLMKPENFIDGQLNLPESGNGIPDILDEAAWGVKHLLSLQLENGGIGTWIETAGHPGPGEGLPDQEQRKYYLSAPSRNGSLEYAAATAVLALAMQSSGNAAEAAKYLDSAEKAWDFALEPRNRLVAFFQLNGQMISYMEEAALYGENLLKAATTLYAMTGKEKYLDPVRENLSLIRETFRKDFWKWSPLSWMVTVLYPIPESATLTSEYRQIILKDADKMLADQENAYPYRTLWHAHDAGWVHAMAWGNYHPLRRAMVLIAAHKLSGNEKYLTGAYLANDFHNGANPLGRTMTSGLGKIYPVIFLDLVSYADNIGEFVPGITPYGNTFGLDRNAVKMVYGKNADTLPIFRRYVNLEFLSVPASEYTVWETIAPAAVTTGYLLEKAQLPPDQWKKRRPAGNFRELPGYRALP